MAHAVYGVLAAPADQDVRIGPPAWRVVDLVHRGEVAGVEGVVALRHEREQVGSSARSRPLPAAPSSWT